MEYRFLGRSGLRLSALSFGSWVTFGGQVDVNDAVRLLTVAYDAGVNFFDTAEVYAHGEAERILGEVLRRTGWRRSDLVISTKIFWGGEGPNDRGLSAKHLVEGTEASLRRLGLDYVDLLFCHRPDVHTPIEETVWAMDRLVRQGKALYWGTSEWSADRIRQAHAVARREHLIPPLMEQPQYNMFHRHRVEVEYAPLYDELGLGTTTWSPLASGLLTGKYDDGIPAGSRLALPDYGWLREQMAPEWDRRITVSRRLAEVAAELACTRAQLAIAWCLANEDVSTVILGASREEQLRENLGALDVAERLTPDVLERIEGILDNRPAPERDWRGL